MEDETASRTSLMDPDTDAGYKAPRQRARHERLELLFDPGSLRPLSGHGEGQGERSVSVVAAAGRVEGRDVVCYVQDSGLAGGSVGVAEAETIVRALRRAGRERVPLVAFVESAGARLQEGVAALGGFGRIFTENVALSGRVPQISVMTARRPAVRATRRLSPISS